MRKITGGLIVACVCARAWTAPSPLQVPNTWNDGVATGNWSADANWSLGHKPTVGETVFITNTTAAAGYSVTLDTPWTSIGTNALVIGNASGTATNTLTIASTLSVDRDRTPLGTDSKDPVSVRHKDRFWDISVNAGGRIVLQDGGTLIRRYGAYAGYYDPDQWQNYFLNVNGGGSFRQTGGLLQLTDNSWQAIALGDASGSVTSRWEMTGGRFVWDDKTSGGSSATPMMLIRKTGRFEMSGDAVYTNRVENGKHARLSWRMAGGVADFSGQSRMKFERNGGYVFFGAGQTTVREQAQLLPGGKGIYVGVAPRDADAVGSVARLDVRDDARLSCENCQNFLVGGQGGKSGILTYDSSRTDGNLCNVMALVGVNDGYGELNLCSGTLRAGIYYGFYVGGDDLLPTGNGSYSADWHRASVEHAAPTGLVRVTGGKLSIGGHATQDWGYRWLVGLVVGNGSRRIYPEQSLDPFESRLYNGRMEVSGGEVETESHLAVGAGRAVGSFLQTGGSVLVSGSCATPMLVGVAGGWGDYVLSNGTLTVKSSLHVGGATTNMLRRTGWDADHGYGMPPPMWYPGAGNWCSYPSDRHDAKGRMVVAGYDSAKPAVLKVTNAITVSSDGAGTFEVGGSYATIEANDMIVSNAVTAVAGGESKIRFVADANGLSTIKLSGNLTIAAGAKLEVDMRAYAGASDQMFKIIDCASRTGSFKPENMKGCRYVEMPGDPCVYVKARAASGLAIIVR